MLAGLPQLKWLAFHHNVVSDVSAIEGLFAETVILWHNNPAFPKGGTKIVGPWLWVIVPGDRITDELVEKAGGDIVGIALLIELTELNGREKLRDLPIFSIFEF